MVRVRALVLVPVVGVLFGSLVAAAPASAATPSRSTTATISAGTPTSAGTPMVPPSVLNTTVTPGMDGVTNGAMPQLMFQGSSATQQSIQAQGFNTVAGMDPVTLTNTGQGYSSGTYCTASFAQTGAWGVAPGITRTSRINRQVTGVDQAYCNGVAYSVSVTCYSPSLGTFVAGNGWGSGSGPSPVSAQCASGSAPVVAWGNPTDATQVALGSDGLYIPNPAYADLIASSTQIGISKTCTAIPPSTAATQTVTALGIPGTGVTPSVSCPSGFYATGSSVFSQLPGAQARRTLYSTGLAAGAAAAYAACLQAPAGCDLWIAVDGVRCVLTGIGCADWYQRVAEGAGNIACHWGGYTMPSAGDCGAIQNCYQVPLDSIQGNSSGAGCGIDPGASPSTPPKPVQDGKPVAPAPRPAGGSTSGTGPSPGSSGSASGSMSAPAGGSTSGTGPGSGSTTVVPGGGTTTIIVNAPEPAPVPLPGDQEGSSCFSINTSAAGSGPTGRAGILAIASDEGVPANPHTSPEGYPSFDVMSTGAQNSRIAEKMRADHGRLGLHYVISQMRIASEKSDWNWRAYSPITDQGDFQHVNHVHVSYGLPVTSGAVSMNPIDYVYAPVHCALSRALVPSDESRDRLAAATSGEGQDPFGKWYGLLGDYAGAFAVAPGSCRGPAVPLRFDLGPAGMFTRTIYPADACTDPAKSIAHFGRLGALAGLYVGAGIVSLYSIMAGLGYNLRLGDRWQMQKDNDLNQQMGDWYSSSAYEMRHH